MQAFWSPGWTIGGCLAAAAVALIVSDRVARATGLSRWSATAYVALTGAVIAATISPRSRNDTYFVFVTPRRSCELIPVHRELSAVVTSAEWQFNLLLFVPLGVLAGRATRAGARRALVLLGMGLPIVVEVVQYVLPRLYRVCQGLDVATNWLGLVAGYALAAVVSLSSRRRDDEPTRAESSSNDPVPATTSSDDDSTVSPARVDHRLRRP